eukprot:gb/GFBE01036840.1/.p1 GENE.gb/GFBE01036840.1/~~gb/GFBE01036840.1/.p1  ORF type:complete len:454 (+),score=90.41 gb/GFBE01036840.1/:1-1362(+)
MNLIRGVMPTPRTIVDPDIGPTNGVDSRDSDLRQASMPMLLTYDASDDEDYGPRHHDHFSNFSLFMIGVIIANSLQIGAEHQWKPSEMPQLQTVYFCLDCGFATLYVIEVAVNWTRQKSGYLTHFWNLVDVALTLLAIGTIALSVGGGSSVLADAKVLRLIRFIRLFRLFRVMVTVPDLKMVVDGLYLSMKGLSWVISLIAVLVYMFAIFFTIEIQEELYDDEFKNVNYFGDMAHSLMTLLDIAILAEWGEIVRPVLNHQPWLLPFFACFALLSSFGMLNVMIGVIVDSTQAARKEIEDEKKRRQIEYASETWKKTIHSRGLSQAALEGLSPEERAAKEPERISAINSILQSLLDDEDNINFPEGLLPEDVIALLDFDASGSLSHKEFETGLKRLFLGDNFQLTCLILTVLGKMRNEQAEGQKRVEKEFAEILQRLERIEKRTTGEQPASKTP